MKCITRRLTILGQFDESELFDFAQYFANRLELCGAFRDVALGQIEIDLTGAPELIDMFEMAHWMGPRSANVVSVECTELPEIAVRANSFVRI